MSIVHDALKKIQASGKISFEAKPDKVYKPKFKFKTYLPYILVVCFGFFIASVFFGLSRPLLRRYLQPSKISKNTVPVNPPQPQENPALEIIPTAPKEAREEPQGRFVLNGVFFSEDEGYALINNRILKMGDTIGGATVVGISKEEVELDSKGSIIKLSTAK
jgi:hypothetical protein